MAHRIAQSRSVLPLPQGSLREPGEGWGGGIVSAKRPLSVSPPQAGERTLEPRL
ncbi:hypothetical protein GJW-30_1_01527 [Variibacter gotjawalensis]|uniref:Uncharacterized protein n=1 Tax=Variibacter gotjawalensis TaxID=1333996 RepID=A0A0S3PSQ2_9BRAD|nr:hypothetical protein [Variibacter gotjawalensis]RZS51163.1 hypothetical protein EV661_3638 [Variibacter gotjawalensis]BAT58999.1 hypothetical protein GJW-30_1_01527 [Variibacter gotjawalensis]